jgi:ABC-type nitrate/sulfonate/bicarbonate transport system ATPase subunit
MVSTAGEAPVEEPRVVSGEQHGVVADGVARRFDNGVTALEGMSLRALPREVVAVVGPSGCGKSTLLELICGLQSPDEGTVASDPAVLMPQRDLLLPWLGALDNAALALRATGAGKRAAAAGAREAFARAGLDGFEDTLPHELSGGMRQRVAFVRTLLSGKPVLCLDEPFGALDALTRTEMQGWLTDVLAQAPRTVVLVTHDVEEALVLADRVVVMSGRPGRALDALDVPLARPRERTAPELVELRRRILERMGEPR